MGGTALLVQDLPGLCTALFLNFFIFSCSVGLDVRNVWRDATPTRGEIQPSGVVLLLSREPGHLLRSYQVTMAPDAAVVA